MEQHVMICVYCFKYINFNNKTEVEFIGSMEYIIMICVHSKKSVIHR